MEELWQSTRRALPLTLLLRPPLRRSPALCATQFPVDRATPFQYVLFKSIAELGPWPPVFDGMGVSLDLPGSIEPPPLAALSRDTFDEPNGSDSSTPPGSGHSRSRFVSNSGDAEDSATTPRGAIFVSERM